MFCDLMLGDMFGEYAAIDGANRPTSIEARTRCQVASMQAMTFRSLLSSEPPVAMALMRDSSENPLAHHTDYEFSALAVSDRIHAELLRLASLTPCTGEAVEIYPTPTHADIQPNEHSSRGRPARELSRLSGWYRGAPRSHPRRQGRPPHGPGS